MISGEKIFLRAMGPIDAEIIYELENDSKLWHLSNTLVPFSMLKIEQFIKNSSDDLLIDLQLRLIICEKKGKKTIGLLDLFNYDPIHLRAGVGIIVIETFRNKGYAKEALTLLSDYSSKSLRLHQLYCNILSSNEQSLKLFEKEGYKRCGEKLEWVWTGEEYENEIILQKLL